jgi:hypothetical protein
VDPPILQALERARPAQPAASALIAPFDELQQALGRAGIEVALLKGLYFAQRLYGSYERRAQYDLDVLVSARQRRAARDILERLGYRRKTYDLHSDTFTRGDSKVDVHPWLRRAPAYRLDEDAIWCDLQPVQIESIGVQTLSDEFNLVMLGLSCFEDLGQGMAKIKQLLDLFLFLRQLDATVDWSAFFARRTRERIDGILSHVFALVALMFEGVADLPRLDAELRQRQDRHTVATRDLALGLVSAPRKHPANLTWFASVYPGNVWRYLAWFWVSGFPQNVGDLQPTRVLATLRAAAFNKSA